MTLKAAAEVALRGMVGRNAIDYVMVEARADVEAGTHDFLQELMDGYQCGVAITKVSLQEVDAPPQVREAFHEVVRAREDKERLCREAEGYAEDIVPKDRGEKEQMILAAEAYKQQRILRAQGDTEKFLEILEEYQKAKDVTRQRLYLETIERIFPEVEKIIIDSEAGGDLLQFLPLKELTAPGEAK
jgi:membrane protease subunit HflK